MNYEDMVAIGANLNDAIQRALVENYNGRPDDPNLVGAIAQAVLVQIDQAGYKIERK